MKKVITINLNGNAFQLEEQAFEALRTYLDGSTLKLSGNPDKDEIMSDLEQAIGDKCAKFLNPNKNVVTADDMGTIIQEMGLVDAAPHGSEENSTDSGNSYSTTPKRLYQIKEGSFISGVCTGIAAYFNVDVMLIRILFLILSVITLGGALLAYILMAIFIPRANTSEEQAAAHGEPFNAQELISRAKAGYYNFKSQREWRKQKNKNK